MRVLRLNLSKVKGEVRVVKESGKSNRRPGFRSRWKYSAVWGLVLGPGVLAVGVCGLGEPELVYIYKPHL